LAARKQIVIFIFTLPRYHRVVPLEKQQYHALMAENGILQIDESEMARLAERIRLALAAELTDGQDSSSDN
jgi:histidine triad (HIT) family protein